MKNSFNLNSTEWCDIIFDGKNKSYGAFELRQSSWKRHIVAFGIIIIAVVLVSSLPLIMDKVNAKPKIYMGNMGERHIIVDMGTDKKLDKEIEKPFMPEAPKEFRKMEKFVPPIISKNEDVTDDNEMTSMSQLIDNKDAAIGKFVVENGSTDASAARKEFEKEVTGEGTGSGKGKSEKEEIFVSVEFPPQFPGGEAEMYKYIYDNLKYPISDQEMGNHGRVILRFVVTKTGEISGLAVIKGVSPGCDKEALKVISNMPKWIAGKQNGIPVAVYFTLPIVFQLK